MSSVKQMMLMIKARYFGIFLSVVDGWTDDGPMTFRHDSCGMACVYAL